MIEPGNIIKNLSPTEAVIIDKIRKLGSKYSLSYTGVNSNKRASKILDEQQMEALAVLASDGEFNFKGDPKKFVLFAEAERINSAYQFDPLFAINCSIVDPLPHQVKTFKADGIARLTADGELTKELIELFLKSK